MGGVRFIKWAQDLVSFVKCEPPSLLRGDKRYNAFKDILAPISFFRRHHETACSAPHGEPLRLLLASCGTSL